MMLDQIALELGLIYGILSLGVWVGFRVLDFPDLTCDGSFVLGGVLSALWIRAGGNPWGALGVGFLGGSLAGALTGCLFYLARVPDLLSGILTAFMLYSVHLRLLGGLPQVGLAGYPTCFGSHQDLPILLGLTLGVWAGLSLLFGTDFGLALRSIGQNKALARRSGVKVPLGHILGLGLSNGLIGLSGGLLTQKMGFADVGSGAGTLIVAMAGVMLGESLFKSTKLWISMGLVLLGSLLYRLLTGLALYGDLLGFETGDMNLLTGFLVIAIIVWGKRKTPCFS
jgi:putative ABC transport system permease protein